MNQRILVLSASVGAGHLRAAEAVTLALQQLAPAATIENVDVLKLTNAAFRKVYAQSYLDLVNKAPHLLGYLYDLLDRPAKLPHLDKFRGLLQRANLKKCNALVTEKPWDLIVHTHFLPAEIVARLKRRQELDVPHFVVTTDFDAHRLWFHQPAERFFAATEESAVYLQSLGVPADTLCVSGIPIHPVFSEKKSRDLCLKNQGLKGDRPVVLQLAGGFGVGPVRQIFQGLMAQDTPVEVAVVCGRNAALKTQLEKEPVPRRHRARILGFTTDMDELMRAADVVVSKPGGLTTSEALACGAAMVVMNPIPGQETRNSDFLLEHGAAIKVNALPLLAYKLGKLLGDSKRLAELKRNAKALGRPRAAFDVAQQALDYVKRERDG